MDKDKALDRVRKCIALGNNEGATEAERERAMTQAHKLMAKFNLDMAELSNDKEDRTHKQLKMANNPANRRIMNAICKLFMVEYLYAKGGHNHFIGTELNTTVAIEMSEWIITTARSEAYKRADMQCALDGTPQSQFKTAFMHAVGDTIYHRVVEIIHQQRQQKSEYSKPGKGLVLADVYKQELATNRAFAESIWGSLDFKSKARKRTSLDYKAYEQGVAHGNSVNLNKQIH